jgi:hypothetical protein
VLSINAEGHIQHHLIVVFGEYRGAMLHGVHCNTIATLLLTSALHCLDPLSRAPRLQDAYQAAVTDADAAIKARRKSAKKELVSK